MDKGIGDTLGRVISATGLDFLARVYEDKTGRDCGCNARKEKLNKAVPYGKQTL